MRIMDGKSVRIFFLLLSLTSLYITLSALHLQSTVSPGIMAIASAAVVMLNAYEWKKPNRHTAMIHVLQVAALALLQWSSGLDWTFPLFLVQGVKMALQSHHFGRTAAVFSGIALLYSSVRFPYANPGTGDILLIFMEQFTALGVALLLHFTSPRDGMISPEQLQIRLDSWIRQREGVFLLLVESVKDFRSESHLGLFRKDVQILVSSLLDTFPEAETIARFGRNEFALAWRQREPEKHVESVSQRLQSLEKELRDTRLYSGIAYAEPASGFRASELIHTVEERIFAQKQENSAKMETQRMHEERLILVGELAAGLAHEIRNPLSALKGFLQLAKNDNYDIRRWYDLMMNEVDRMSELTSEFLHFSKPRSSRFGICDINDCVLRVVSLTAMEVHRKGHLLIRSESAVPVYANMDQDKIVQVLINLVRNSLEAMDRPGTIRISCREMNGQAIIDVQDTGRGIPAESLPHVFEPFYSTKSEGTGLGLAICKKIVQDHGGTMEVQSEPGRGSTFTVILPAEPAPEETTV
jgi:Signal transduction histidine kinase